MSRIQIQTNDIGGLALEVWIIAGHVPFQTVGFHTGNSPNPVYCVFADVQFAGQFADRPMCRTVLRFPARGFQNPCLQLGRDDGWLLAWILKFQKSAPPSLRNRFFHRENGWSCGLQAFLNLRITAAIGQHQHHTCSQDISGGKASRYRHLPQFISLLRTQFDWLGMKGAT